MKSLNDPTEKLQMTGFQSPNTGQFNKKIPNTIEWQKQIFFGWTQLILKTLTGQEKDQLIQTKNCPLFEHRNQLSIKIHAI